MDVKVVLSSDEILRGLKHYRRIAKQDLMCADDDGQPATFRRHAEARREVYGTLARVAENGTPEDVARSALNLYKDLPFVTGTPDGDHVDVKGREHALENFFLMIGLEPKVRREVRRQRPPMKPRTPEA